MPMLCELHNQRWVLAFEEERWSTCIRRRLLRYTKRAHDEHKRMAPIDAPTMMIARCSPLRSSFACAPVWVLVGGSEGVEPAILLSGLLSVAVGIVVGSAGRTVVEGAAGPDTMLIVLLLAIRTDLMTFSTRSILTMGLQIGQYTGN